MRVVLLLLQFLFVLNAAQATDLIPPKLYQGVSDEGQPTFYWYQPDDQHLPEGTSYIFEWTTDLNSNEWIGNYSLWRLVSNDIGGGYWKVTLYVDTSDLEKLFFRLRLEQR